MDDMGSWDFAMFISFPDSIDLLEFCGADRAHVVCCSGSAVDNVATFIEKDEVVPEVTAMLTPLSRCANMCTVLSRQFA